MAALARIRWAGPAGGSFPSQAQAALLRETAEIQLESGPMMIELTDRYMPCEECEGFVDAETESFLAVIIPLRDGDRFRGKRMFHAA